MTRRTTRRADEGCRVQTGWLAASFAMGRFRFGDSAEVSRWCCFWRWLWLWVWLWLAARQRGQGGVVGVGGGTDCEYGEYGAKAKQSR